MKALLIIFIFLGEAASIYAELIAAKPATAHGQLSIFLKTFPVIIVGMTLVLIGYIYGISTFKNIWIISVTSIVSILIVEPILVYAIFHQMPTRGALIGFIFGTLGFLATIFIK